MSYSNENMNMSLGDILREALVISRRSVEVKNVVQETTNFSPPEWMILAFKGRKIDAIKSLRQLTVNAALEGNQKDHSEGVPPITRTKIDIWQAKIVVESITDNLWIERNQI